MKLSDFHYDLPDELIARYPTADRTASRLLQLDGATGEVAHRQFTDLVDILRPNDLLVFNDTRVIPARLWGRKSTGGKIEILVERIIDEFSLLAHVRSSKSPKPGSELYLQRDEADDQVHATAEVLGRQDDLFVLKFDDKPVIDVLNKIGHMPLPPYIDRPDESSDQERYQTVYGVKEGAVAAPTAGLHFTEDFIEKCLDKGVDRCFVTLHVGAGTFQSVRVEDVTEHKMHSEYIEVSDEVVAKVKATREKGGRVVAVGTTAVRSLETASMSGSIQAFSGDSDIYIYPGYEFKSVDALLTNFHLPESTLIMLVSAFSGRENILEAYRQAVAERYRFFSYGDAMFLTPQPTGNTP